MRPGDYATVLAREHERTALVHVGIEVLRTVVVVRGDPGRQTHLSDLTPNAGLLGDYGGLSKLEIFVVYLLIATFMVLNLFIAVVVNAMQTQVTEDLKDEGDAHAREILEEVRALRRDIETLRLTSKA